MFNLILLDDEYIKIIEYDALLKTENDYLKLVVIITNKRLLTLDYPKGLDALKFGKMINYPLKREVIFECNLDEINSVVAADDFNRYGITDGRYFYLKADEIKKIFS